MLYFSCGIRFVRVFFFFSFLCVSTVNVYCVLCVGYYVVSVWLGTLGYGQLLRRFMGWDVCFGSLYGLLLFPVSCQDLPFTIYTHFSDFFCLTERGKSWICLSRWIGSFSPLLFATRFLVFKETVKW